LGQDVLNKCAADGSATQQTNDELWASHPGFPLAICFNVHSLCNERCVMCPYKSTDAGKPTRVMDIKGFEKTWKEFLEIGGRIATFNNFSDIFSHPVGMDYVRITLKNQNEAHTYFVTNGLALKKEYVDEIISTGWGGIIYVSCHGFSKETFKKVTGVDAFSNVIEHTKYLASRHPIPERIIIQYATDFSSDDEIKAAISFWGNLGCSVNSFSTHTWAGSSLHRDQTILAGRLAGCRGWGYDAGQPFFQAVIQQNGNLTLCCMDLQGIIIIGNAFENGLAKTWKSKEMRDIIRLIYKGSMDGRTMTICKKCEFAQIVS
jgi:uncharacterized Fe-S cluster-containing radical SAM superfamily protein